MHLKCAFPKVYTSVLGHSFYSKPSYLDPLMRKVPTIYWLSAISVKHSNLRNSITTVNLEIICKKQLSAKLNTRAETKFKK